MKVHFVWYIVVNVFKPGSKPAPEILKENRIGYEIWRNNNQIQKFIDKNNYHKRRKFFVSQSKLASIVVYSSARQVHGCVKDVSSHPSLRDSASCKSMSETSQVIETRSAVQTLKKGKRFAGGVTGRAARSGRLDAESREGSGNSGCDRPRPAGMRDCILQQLAVARVAWRQQH